MVTMMIMAIITTIKIIMEILCTFIMVTTITIEKGGNPLFIFVLFS